MTIALYIAAMALTTYLIRVIPFTLFRKKIKSRFIKSLLYYIPYAVLSAMTLPAIFYSTGTLTALILAYFNLPLIIVALAAAAATFITGFFI